MLVTPWGCILTQWWILAQKWHRKKVHHKVIEFIWFTSSSFRLASETQRRRRFSSVQIKENKKNLQFSLRRKWSLQGHLEIIFHSIITLPVSVLLSYSFVLWKRTHLSTPLCVFMTARSQQSCKTLLRVTLEHFNELSSFHPFRPIALSRCTGGIMTLVEISA